LDNRPSTTTTGSTEERTDRDDDAPPPSYQVYCWGGKWRRLPEGFKFTRNMSVLQAWQSWHQGDGTIPPLKVLEQVDVTDNHIVNGKSRPIRASEARYLQHLKWLCMELNKAANIMPRNTPSCSELVLLYNSEAVQNILPPSTTENSHLRRAEELNRKHAVTVMKRAKRSREGTNVISED